MDNNASNNPAATRKRRSPSPYRAPSSSQNHAPNSIRNLQIPNGSSSINANPYKTSMQSTFGRWLLTKVVRCFTTVSLTNCILLGIGVYLMVMTTALMDRMRMLEHDVQDSRRMLKLKERELYIKELQLGDQEQAIDETSETILGVSDRLHQSADALAEKATLAKKMFSERQTGKEKLSSYLPSLKLAAGEKPKFVFNIGPMKTGSTTLQNYGNSDRVVLRQDGYVWPANAFSMIYSSDTPSIECMLHANDVENYGEDKCPSFHEPRLEKLRLYLERNANLHTYLCDEMFGVLPDKPHVWESLQFMNKNHKVEMVVTYRRYFEWWASFYVQAFKYDQEEELITGDWPTKKWEDVDATKESDRYTNHIIPHHLYFNVMQNDETSIFKRRWNIKHGEMHPTQAQKDRFEPHFPGVKVFNYHLDKDNLVGSFYCHMMPDAKKACDARTRVGTKAHLNSAVNHNYDMLAVQAYELGLIQTEFQGNSRKQLAAAAQHRQEKMLHLSGTNDFPLLCMSDDQLEQLLNMSLKFEREIVPEWANDPGREEEHRAAFQEYVDKKKFCNVDAAKVMEDDEWKSFFRYLRLKPPQKQPQRKESIPAGRVSSQRAAKLAKKLAL